MQASHPSGEVPATEDLNPQTPKPRSTSYAGISALAITGVLIGGLLFARTRPGDIPAAVAGTELQSQPAQAPAPVSVPQPQTGAVPAKIAWESSFESAMGRAKTENRPVMVNFYTDWCGYCKKLDAEVFPDEKVRAESTNFVPVKVNGEQRTDLAQAYGVSGFPTTIFIRPDGSVIGAMPGYGPPDTFVQYMTAARNGEAVPS